MTSGPESRNPSPRVSAGAARVARVGGVATVVGAGVLATVGWSYATSPSQLWRRRRRDLGTGVGVWAAAILSWDFIYYWNHRAMHEVRALWAHHVVHHSSERFNLSTALRQPVSPFGVWVPYGLLSWLGIRPSLIEHARGVNLLYQYWIHTDLVRTLGPGEEVLNTPSHHRVHHGSNQRYLDRNHGSILIVWDRLFGTFAREEPGDPVIYGLTRNIRTYDPLRVVTHEYADMLRDVARSTTWRDRLSFVLRGPGWAYRRRAVLEAAASATTDRVPPAGAPVNGSARRPGDGAAPSTDGGAWSAPSPRSAGSAPE
jgi:sterol desaturase/sphingolipid hydroxylase (fatty acid hydroxylase superfamily)